MLAVMTPEQVRVFQQTVLEYYRANGRHDLPWRQFDASGAIDPYRIMVSEVMLQQTQVPRVIPKFLAFMQQFPDVQALAQAPLADVLKAWSGLGYNRRAKFLWQAARQITEMHHGKLPHTTAELTKLPGIGSSTAGAIVVYAYNIPAVFIETNIRTVVIHHFFSNQNQKVDDKAIADLLAYTLPKDVRTWYWALMDYGTQLKQTVGNLNTLSKSYTKQSAFAGSRRQIRGQVLRLLGQQELTADELQLHIKDERLPEVLLALEAEGLIHIKNKHYKLADA